MIHRETKVRREREREEWSVIFLVSLEFDWESYLDETHSEAAPAGNFKQVRRPATDRRWLIEGFPSVVDSTGERVQRGRETGNDRSEKSRFLVHRNDRRERRTTPAHPTGWHGWSQRLLASGRCRWHPCLRIDGEIRKRETLILLALLSVDSGWTNRSSAGFPTEFHSLGEVLRPECEKRPIRRGVLLQSSACWHWDESSLTLADVLLQQPGKPERNFFKRGQKLEAVDPKHPQIICPATVNNVISGDHRIVLSLDGWSSSNNFKVDYASRELFPAGWCQSVGIRLNRAGGNGRSNLETKAVRDASL